ncbi:MAG: glycosyltransferase family 4 protein [Lentisphaerae bacterium]|nr:glycosyltransferase family 4 protein [Lentisphaerota bacterium]
MPTGSPSLRIVWLARSFLDYRVPVFAALHTLTQGGLRVVYAADYVPDDVQAKAQTALGEHAIPLRGEWKLGAEDRHFLANRNLSLRFQPGLGRLLWQLQPEVVISDGFFKWTVAGACQRVRHGTPLVIAYERTAHTERHAQGFRTWYRRRVARLAGAVACSGSLCAEYVERSLGVPRERIVTGHMVADVPALLAARARVTASAREAQRARWGVAGVVMVCVGRLVEGKGCRELLRAWAALSGSTAAGRAALVFVGDGPLRATLAADVRERGLREVRFAGPVPHDELAASYAAADILVMPTLEDNWSLVVPEAMACGLPVACSRYNGCHPELVQPGRNGWIFDPLDTPSCAATLSEALAAGARLPAMGGVSREIVSAFTPDRAAANLLNACQIARG